MDSNQTIRLTNNSNSFWINLPVRVVAPFIVATSFAVSNVTNAPTAVGLTAIEINESGVSNGSSQNIRSEGNAVARDVHQNSNDGTNTSFEFDLEKYGMLQEKVNGIDKKIDALQASVDKLSSELPTKDWVEKTVLKNQMEKINRATTIRIAIGGIIVSLVVPLLVFVLGLITKS